MSNEDNRNDENDQQIEESEQDVSVTEAVDAETSTDDEGMRSDAIDLQTNVTATPDEPPFEADTEPETPESYSVQCTNKRTGGTTIVSATEMTLGEAKEHIAGSVQYDHVEYSIVDYVDPEFDTSTD